MLEHYVATAIQKNKQTSKRPLQKKPGIELRNKGPWENDCKKSSIGTFAFAHDRK